jgi:hypothetical protein
MHVRNHFGIAITVSFTVVSATAPMAICTCGGHWASIGVARGQDGRSRRGSPAWRTLYLPDDHRVARKE